VHLSARIQEKFTIRGRSIAAAVVWVLLAILST
jgi:hypothetical protein